MRIQINIDGHFLRKPVAELFHKQELLTVPFMTGVNNDEGGWSLASVRVLLLNPVQSIRISFFM